MAKRWTLTGKYREAKGLLRTIPPAYRLLWHVLLDECDYAGIWSVDFDFAVIAVGLPVTEAEALRYFAGDIQVCDDGAKWYLTGFLLEQIGDTTLSDKNPVHQNIKKRLSRFGLDPFPVRERPAPDPSPHRENAAPPPPRARPVAAPETVSENTVFISEKHISDDPPPERERTAAGPIYNINNTTTVFKKQKRVLEKLEIFEEIFSDEIFLGNLAMVHRGKDPKQAFEECYLHFSNALNPPESVGEWKQKLSTWLQNTKTNAKSKSTDTLRADLAARMAKR